MTQENEKVTTENESSSSLSPELKKAMETLLNAKVKDIVAFTQELAKEAGIDLSAVTTTSAGPAAAPVEEKTEFTVNLTDIGANKINIIKVVKELTGLGLMEAKNLVESAVNGPAVIKSEVKKDVAEEIKTKVEAAGGKVSIV